MASLGGENWRRTMVETPAGLRLWENVYGGCPWASLKRLHDAGFRLFTLAHVDGKAFGAFAVRFRPNGGPPRITCANVIGCASLRVVPVVYHHMIELCRSWKEPRFAAVGMTPATAAGRISEIAKLPRITTLTEGVGNDARYTMTAEVE